MDADLLNPANSSPSSPSVHANSSLLQDVEMVNASSFYDDGVSLRSPGITSRASPAPTKPVDDNSSPSTCPSFTDIMKSAASTGVIMSFHVIRPTPTPARPMVGQSTKTFNKLANAASSSDTTATASTPADGNGKESRKGKKPMVGNRNNKKRTDGNENNTSVKEGLDSHPQSHSPVPQVQSSPTPAQLSLRLQFHTPLITHLDRLLDEILHTDPLSLEEQWGKIYGAAPLCEHSQLPLKVYTDGACMHPGHSNATAGSGVFFGHGNLLNCTKCVPGSQTNNQAELYAVLTALQLSTPNCSLLIHTNSEYLINSLTYWALVCAKCGWSVPHGDLLKNIVLWIASQSAPVQFVKVKAHLGNDHNDNADQLAKTGCHLPLPVSGDPDDFSFVPPPPPFPSPSHGPTQPKVSTTFPSKQPSQPAVKHIFRKNSGHITNCGRSSRCHLQTMMRDHIVEASTTLQHSGSFTKSFDTLSYLHP
ncbi:hypothetical protein D9758_015267 [Tetrapyrgos nigripes]|uniref:ribonuclease H n=1 Tax=Tetrapyrgos nigripes TaxID=182062 RepID=A0A8H5FPU4_9AGAR|nr:hypothetical protein D9758_015267 [Tetrapyrgos nigripes]